MNNSDAYKTGENVYTRCFIVLSEELAAVLVKVASEHTPP